MDDVDVRLAGLEARIRTLEAVVGASVVDAPSASEPPAGEPDDRFWALTGLQARLAGMPAGHDGGVLFAGSVELAGGHTEWQISAVTDDLVNLEWSELADTLGALGHPVRLRLLQAVATGTHTSTELQALPGLGTSGQIYHHLRALTGAGWLRAGTRGRWAVPPERLVPLLVVIAAARR